MNVIQCYCLLFTVCSTSKTVFYCEQTQCICHCSQRIFFYFYYMNGVIQQEEAAKVGGEMKRTVVWKTKLNW